jgi:hypothetical protein
MMMAHDSSSSNGPSLSQGTIIALTEALSEYLSSSGDSAPLREALARTASEAREKQILPEHLLITLKHIWSRLPGVKSMRDNGEQTRMLERVVTMCIGEYYGAPQGRRQ